jgi:hypothetical protein
MTPHQPQPRPQPAAAGLWEWRQCGHQPLRAAPAPCTPPPEWHATAQRSAAQPEARQLKLLKCNHSGHAALSHWLPRTTVCAQHAPTPTASSIAHLLAHVHASARLVAEAAPRLLPALHTADQTAGRGERLAACVASVWRERVFVAPAPSVVGGGTTVVVEGPHSLRRTRT